MPDLEVVVVGGGIAGSSIALNLSDMGARVTVVERESRFRDRVRGEVMFPWGVAEAERLGVLGHLSGVSMELREWATKIHPLDGWARDLRLTTPSGMPAVTFPHADAQEALLGAAEAAGAEVRRGTVVAGVEPGTSPTVVLRGGSGRNGARLKADLVVGADGRSSVTASSAGFEFERRDAALSIAGAMLAGTGAPEGVGELFMRPDAGLMALIAPLPGDRHRVYAGYHLSGGTRNLSGPTALGGFKEVLTAAGAPEEWFDGAALVGPLADFPGTETWTRAAVEGVALVGDAGAISDPNWGCGLSLAMRDVRVLVESLGGADDPHVALAAYAAEHAAYHGALRRQTTWLEQVFRTPGPDADALRSVAMPRIAANPSIAPDVVGAGPDGPSDELAMARFFGAA